MSARTGFTNSDSPFDRVIDINMNESHTWLRRKGAGGCADIGEKS